MTGRVEVVPGGHLVACVDGVVVVVAHRDDAAVTAESESLAVLDKLAELVREAASRETRRTGRTFARLASTWLMSREDEERVEFGVLTPGTRALAVFLHGRITAVLEGDDGREVLHGSDAGFTVDRVVLPTPARAAALFVDEETPRDELPAPGVWSLGAGRMPGSGAVLWVGEAGETTSSGGFLAVRDFGSPSERPPLGVLVLDDGTSFALDGDLVIGREPERSERVRRGAKPIRLHDVSGGMSRVHAEVRLAEREVTVVDRGSANGTHIKPPGRAEWMRAVPGHPVALEPGSQLMLGGRVFTFESPQ
ncbi:FHA domain-containing protein [Nocardia inohanensis]|uniref:FHA domain-containing protein n=1 Tax=Nocardia inohanensis TaxID=209246 RepID=UPI0008348E98|nr:FHA domain-containing protein [Nocardia inohanensis]